MGDLVKRYEQLCDALVALEKAISTYSHSLEREDESFSYVEHDEVVRAFRDSLIKRFEFTIELFWKYLQDRLFTVNGVKSVGPKGAVREACQAGLIEVEDAEKILEIIGDRNNTSHRYQEEIADRIASRIPAHFQLMKKYVEELKPER